MTRLLFLGLSCVRLASLGEGLTVQILDLSLLARKLLFQLEVQSGLSLPSIIAEYGQLSGIDANIPSNHPFLGNRQAVRANSGPAFWTLRLRPFLGKPFPVS